MYIVRKGGIVTKEGEENDKRIGELKKCLGLNKVAQAKLVIEESGQLFSKLTQSATAMTRCQNDRVLKKWKVEVVYTPRRCVTSAVPAHVFPPYFERSNVTLTALVGIQHQITLDNWSRSAVVAVDCIYAVPTICLRPSTVVSPGADPAQGQGHTVYLAYSNTAATPLRLQE